MHLPVTGRESSCLSCVNVRIITGITKKENMKTQRMKAMHTCRRVWGQHTNSNECDRHYRDFDWHHIVLWACGSDSDLSCLSRFSWGGVVVTECWSQQIIYLSEAKKPIRSAHNRRVGAAQKTPSFFPRDNWGRCHMVTHNIENSLNWWALCKQMLSELRVLNPEKRLM